MSFGRSLTLTLTLISALNAGSRFCRGQSDARSTTDRSIQNLQLHVKMYQEDYKSYDALGAAYIQKGRETAHSSYYELAKQALNKSLDLLSNDPAAASAKTHLAVVSMAEHEFEDAFNWAQEALALGSGDPSPWALVGDALADMGRYDEAASAYARLRDISGGNESAGLAYEHDSRMAYLGFIRGDAQGAKVLMRTAIATAVALHMPAENVAWSDYQLGDICFRSGDLICAEQADEAGLQIEPGSYRNLAGLAEVRAAQQRYAEAVALYEKAIAVVPYPMYAAALYDLQMKLGHAAEAKKQYDLIEFIGKLNPINQRLFYRDLALFYADHNLKLGESLSLAKDELGVRQDVYTWDIMAWVFYKNGRASEAAAAMEKALAFGTRDSLLDFHAGMIEASLGDRERARQLLESALAMNPHFHVFYDDEARATLAQMAVPGQPSSLATANAGAASAHSAEALPASEGAKRP